MSVEIPASRLDLLKWETKAFAFLGLVLKDGTPHVTPLWFDWDGTHIIINTARGRVKDKVLQRRPRVALAITAPTKMYNYLYIRGHVVEETEEGAYDMICRLNEKYHGSYEFPKKPGQIRVTYKILPDSALAGS